MLITNPLEVGPGCRWKYRAHRILGPGEAADSFGVAQRVAPLALGGLVGERQSPRAEPYRQLEALNLNGIYWSTSETFDDGEALFEAVCERGLEGVVC
jgi:hypothetical protein